MAWRQFFNRSIAQIRDETARVMRASPLDPHANTHTLPLASLRQPSDVRDWAIGADSDIGGMSWCKLEAYPSSSSSSSSSSVPPSSFSLPSSSSSSSSLSDSQSSSSSELATSSPQTGLVDRDAGKGRFYGNLSSRVNAGMKLGGNKVDRSGYAGMRSKARPTMFGNQTWDTSRFTFLKIRCKPSPDEGMRYFVNIQTDGPVRSDLFQHRLWLGPPNKWQDVLVPFADFTLTNTGTMSELQIEMYREKVRTVGISVLGPGEGPFELGVEAFECVNVGEEERDHLLNERKMLGEGREREVAYVMSKEKEGL